MLELYAELLALYEEAEARRQDLEGEVALSYNRGFLDGVRLSLEIAEGYCD